MRYMYWSVVTTAAGQEPSVAAACRDAPAVWISRFPQGKPLPSREAGRQRASQRASVAVEVVESLVPKRLSPRLRVGGGLGQ
eukprot:3489773-Prymnesium_polylepis.1